MSAFRDALRGAQAGRTTSGRRWFYVAYDQLSTEVGPWADVPPGERALVFVESREKAERRPYHQRKLALLLANGRQAALEMAREGALVRHVATDGGFAPALADIAREVGPLHGAEPAERELRRELAPLVDDGALTFHRHRGWLTTEADFDDSQRGPPYRMDAFYRHVRRKTGILMRDGKPLGGKMSFDTENRLPFRGTPKPPRRLTFAHDEVTREVLALVAERFGHHPGALDAEILPATRADAEQTFRHFVDEALDAFGPYEDAIAVAERTLFHARISGLLNLHRLLPARVVAEVEKSPARLASREGFVRQVLGWREMVRHVHRVTDGFRGEAPRNLPQDGGWSRWRNEPFPGAPPESGASPSHLGAKRRLPLAFWGARSGLACLDEVVRSVWEEGYSHHITRLMVLSNLATLLDVEPRELTDWFWVAYEDAYDWVVEPNVLGMGTFAVGDLMTTKPYVAGTAYLHKMGDACGGCRFDPSPPKAGARGQRSLLAASPCPITRLYWAFLARHEAKLAGNERMKLVLAQLRRRSAQDRDEDAAVFERVSRRLDDGGEL